MVKLFRQRLHYWQSKQLISGWSMRRLDLEHKLDHRGHFLAKVIWNAGVFAFDYLFVEPLHVIGAKWRNQCAQFVKETTHRPDIRLTVVWQIFPDLGTRVVRSPCLGVGELILLFNDFADIQVPEFESHILK
jgi:hypothetical protein